MGSLLSLCGGILLFHLSTFFPGSVGAVLMAGTVLSCVTKKHGWMLIVLLAFLFAGYRVPPPLSSFACPDAVLRVRVTEHPLPGQFGYRQRAVILASDNCDTSLEGREVILFTPDPLDAGNSGILHADVKGTPPYRNPQSVGSEPSLKATVRALHAVEPARGVRRFIGTQRQRLHALFHRTFSPPVAAFLDAVITGDRRSLSNDARRAFSATGLAHLLAISGTHFGIFSLLLFSSMTFALRRIPHRALVRMSLFLKPSEAAAVLSIPFMVFYLLLSGAAIPAIRSFLMINVFLFGYLLGRTGVWKHTLAIAAAVILVHAPDALVSPSFVLSFSAVAAIGFALEIRKEIAGESIVIPGLQESSLMKLKRRGMDMFTVTAAAFIGTLPVSLYLFHVFPSLSLLTNMVLTPLICFLLVPFSLLASGVYLVTGQFPFASLLETGTALTLACIRWIADIPHAALPVRAFPAALIPGCYLGLFLCTMRKTRTYGLIVIAFCFAVIAAFAVVHRPQTMEVTFLDTGQAESSVVTFPDGNVMVIDTGKDGTQTVGYLDYLGITTVDALFLTHSGSDHAGGLEHVLGLKDVRSLMDNGRIDYTLPPSDTMRHVSLGRGDVVEGTDYRLIVLHPYAGFTSSVDGPSAADNNDSLVLRIERGGFSVLLTGDIERTAEEDLASLGDRLESDILKVAHHGSATSSSAEFLFFVRPALAVISAGLFNPYGHPHEDTMERLAEIPVLTTAHYGAIKVSADHKGVSVRTFEDFRFRRPRNISEEMHNYLRLFRTW